MVATPPPTVPGQPFLLTEDPPPPSQVAAPSDAPAFGFTVAPGQVPFVVPVLSGGTDLEGVAIALSGGMLGVPAAVIAGPGLLVLVVIGVQSVGTLVWAPAVRSLRGDSRRRVVSSSRRSETRTP